MSNPQDKLNYRYERIGEISYWIMLVFTIVLIVVASVGTAIVRKGLGLEITLIPKDILDFFEKVLWVFVLPVSIKIGGETFYKTILAWKGISADNPMNQSMYGGYGQPMGYGMGMDPMMGYSQNMMHTPMGVTPLESDPAQIQKEHDEFYGKRGKMK
jgi:hypothetical protein